MFHIVVQLTNPSNQTEDRPNLTKPFLFFLKADDGLMFFSTLFDPGYVEEFSTSNFVAITKSGVYLTPDSVSVLDSVTNASLEKLAVDMGLKVERRKMLSE